MRHLSLALLCLALAAAGSSEPQTRPSGAFAFSLETVVPGTPVAAFDAFTRDTLEWWDHTFSEKPKKLHFETRPGGGFVEIFDDHGNGAWHATVIFSDRGKALRFTGPLGLSGSAIEMVHSLEFEQAEGGTRVSVSVHGHGELEKDWPATVEKVWQHFLLERFKPYMEKR